MKSVVPRMVAGWPSPACDVGFPHQGGAVTGTVVSERDGHLRSKNGDCVGCFPGEPTDLGQGVLGIVPVALVEVS